MRGRIGFAWALAGVVSLACLLVFACHPSVLAGPPAGMSAPVAPAASIESAPAVRLLPSPFDPHGPVLGTLRFSPALGALGATSGTRQDEGAAPPNYGPLHRRPPPSFS